MGTNNDHDGHNHDDQLGEIYLMILNELNCTFGVSFYHAMHFSAFARS